MKGKTSFAAAAVLVSSSVLAQETTDVSELTLSELPVSPYYAVILEKTEQLMAQTQDRFEGLDRNGDGVITAAEMGQARQGEGGLQALDQDDDGSLDRAEFAQFTEKDAVPVVRAGQELSAPLDRTRERFDMLDGDSDGYISRSEAERSAALSESWAKNEFGEQDRIDRVEYAQLEALIGLDMIPVKRAEPARSGPEE